MKQPRGILSCIHQMLLVGRPVYKIAFISFAIGPLVNTFTLSLVVYEFADVFIAIRPGICTFAMALTVFPFAHVFTATGPFIGAGTIALAVGKLTGVSRSTLVDERTFAALAVAGHTSATGNIPRGSGGIFA